MTHPCGDFSVFFKVFLFHEAKKKYIMLGVSCSKILGQVDRIFIIISFSIQRANGNTKAKSSQI